MNYGKFFRLNQRTSKIEEGVAIYDYIDLPAYFEASESNEMSPKYPISVTITEDSVRFRVHYSAYKCKHKRQNHDIESYSYKVEEAFKKDPKSTLRHMEEVLIELNYDRDSTSQLYQTIKTLYYTKYPYLLLEKSSNNDRDNNKDTEEEKTTFIHSLIQKRYGGGNTEPIYNNNIEEELYLKLRENQDRDSSYSTLWLMDIICDNKKESINLFEGDIVVKFLRKLLLDFMFDLKHSDVFQTSKYYQIMYSGLMANFYFSALMHKCEYYFYRGLINDVIHKQISNEETRKRHIRNLYADELAEAEDLWIQDIMDSQSDIYFDYNRPKTIWGNIKKEWNRNKFQNHMSWFAEPEEELRRVCFTMKDDLNIPHICNVDTLVEYLRNRKYKKEMEGIISIREKNRIIVSQWFLKRYDFSDMVHFHLFRHANLVYLFFSLILLLFVILDPHAISSINNVIESISTKKNWEGISLPSLGWCEGILLLGSLVTLIICAKECKLVPQLKSKLSTSILYKTRLKLTWKRLFVWMGIQLLAFSLVVIGLQYNIAYLFLALLILFVIKYLISNLHLLYPRLVASIVTAWLTLAAGNDLFAAFFDSIISPIMIVCLSVIVFIFVLYEINRIVPLETTINKLYRSFELTIISYTISLIVGAFVINFTGERILERSGVIKDFYADYVNNKSQKTKIEGKTYRIECDSLLPDTMTDKKRVEMLKDVSIKYDSTNESHNISTIVPIGENKQYSFFFLRDFWIQFSFVAMFIGIFIQMIFEEKRITEF